MRKIVAISVGLPVMFAALGACGGSSKSSSNRDTGATTTIGSGDNGGNDELSALVEKAKKARIKITYEQDDGDTITIAQDGNGKSAYTSDGDTIYSDGNTTVSCDGTGADAKCTEIPGGRIAGSILTLFTSVFTGLANLNSSVYGGHLSDETIAGRSAKCATFKASDFAGLAAIAGRDDHDAGAHATICVDADTGFLLKLETKSDTETKETFLATEVGEPSDADLTPPSTPETLPGIGNITIPSIPGISVPGQNG